VLYCEEAVIAGPQQADAEREISYQWEDCGAAFLLLREFGFAGSSFG
jgi:hypothetical protein